MNRASLALCHRTMYSYLYCAALLFGCGTSSTSPDTETAPASATNDSTRINSDQGKTRAPTIISDPADPQPKCDDSQPPFVMAHGFIGAGDTWSRPVRLFTRNGHCVDRYYAFDWNSIDREADHARTLDIVIDEVRRTHGVDKVDLIGHSAGGGVSYTYMEDPDRAKKIRNFRNSGTPRAACARPACAAHTSQRR